MTTEEITVCGDVICPRCNHEFEAEVTSKVTPLRELGSVESTLDIIEYYNEATNMLGL